MFRLKTNHAKSQFWGCTPEALTTMLQAGFQASDTMQVLGATLGGEGRELSELESQRQQAAPRKSRRISLLPVGLKLKSRLAATILTPMAGWRQGICGRFPSQSECKSFFTCYNCNLSTKTPNFPKGRACPEVKKIFGFGHTADLGFYSLQRTLRASFLWHHFRSKTGVKVQWSPTFARALAAQLRPLGWTALRDFNLLPACQVQVLRFYVSCPAAFSFFSFSSAGPQLQAVLPARSEHQAQH